MGEAMSIQEDETLRLYVEESVGHLADIENDLLSIEEQREIALSMLKKLGYSVSSASSGEEAVEYMRNNSVDILLLDMIIDPGIEGLETYKRILEFHPGQKAIIASGFSETERVGKLID